MRTTEVRSMKGENGEKGGNQGIYEVTCGVTSN